ncbi:MAG TPA: 50S ribosomal protein L34e [Candidatus Nanoarchaeia archaeon]|nr:50S ribosomal protein L34e [Candidatus Nanoarchaeia archaeon]
MAEGRFKSRTFRRIRTRTPGGSNVLRYGYRKPPVARCSNCGGNLSGIPRRRPAGMKKLSKSERTVERMFGGFYCSPCSRKEIKRRVRENLF